MDLRDARHTERPLVKTKIIATIGPATEEEEALRELLIAGVDVVRLNFAHGTHDWFAKLTVNIRKLSQEMNRPVAILGDLAGPKIRLGKLGDDGMFCGEDERFQFVRNSSEDGDSHTLKCTYEGLIDELNVGDRILLADGTVAMRVVEKADDLSKLVCKVERAGLIRSRQGINLPGATLSTPSLTAKDHDDLKWIVGNDLDFVGLSFVRSSNDIDHLRSTINQIRPDTSLRIVAKIEKMEAISDLEQIVAKSDAVMVARGDLGVESDIARVPILQKRIIRLCNRSRVPVITATQMLDSMQSSPFPTRAESSDVANAVLDGSDAVMLSGETAVGKFPAEAVSVMSRIAQEAERLVPSSPASELWGQPRTRARVVTEAVTLGAGAAAEKLNADLIVVATHSGRTAMAVSKQRSRVPILALSDQATTTRRMCLYWGVTPVETVAVHDSPEKLLEFVVQWGRRLNILQSGSRIVLVASTNWSASGHDLMLVHVIP